MAITLYGIDSNKLHNDDFEVIRSDTGNGGWSIHWKYDEDEDGMPSEILVSGQARCLPNGEWNRPNDEDFATAIEKLFQRNGKK